MSKLLLAGNLIDQPWNTKIFDTYFGHYQVVLAKDEEHQLEIEVLQRIDWLDGKFVAWTYPNNGKARDHISNTPEKAIKAYYDSEPIDLGNRSAENVWQILEQIHEQFNSKGTNIIYGLNINSNSYATTLLNIIGINIDNYVGAVNPPAAIGGFPGRGVDVLKNPLYAVDLNLNGTPEGDIIRTGVANDTLRGLAGNDKLSGGGGNDFLFGGPNNDELSGGGEDDHLRGDANADKLNGGDGSDTASYSISTAAVTINLSTGSATGGDAQGDTFTSIENLIGSQYGDTLAGNSGDNTLTGGPGADVFVLSNGKDVITDFDPGSGDRIQIPQDVELQKFFTTGGEGNNTVLTHAGGTLTLINPATQVTIDESWFVAATTGNNKAPQITKSETFTEGGLIYFKLHYTDPDNDAAGFGFRGIKGSGWAPEEHLFTNPSYGHVSSKYVE